MSSSKIQLIASILYALVVSAAAGDGADGSPTTPATSSSSSCRCFPAIFSFGDSKADTGNVQAVLPFETRAEKPPYGRTYFGHPSDRFCDGRLVVDFQAQAYGLPFLSPYFKSLGTDFKHGANFAFSGAGVLPNLTSVAFYLGRQFSQFKRFKQNYLDLPPGHNLIPSSTYFGEGLYVISIGENDYRQALINLQLSAEEIKSTLVPRVIELINTTVKELYEEGARKFLVVNIAADGCISRHLTLLPNEELDDLGCVKEVNNYVQYHNKLLFHAVLQLRLGLPEAQLGYADYFGVNVHILTNASKYGIIELFKACCGMGGKYNYNPNVECAETGVVNGQNVTVSSCQDPSKYINWDGIHLTEQFYELVADAFLQGQFVDKPPSCSFHCRS